MVRVWQFLLPESGEHVLTLNRYGKKKVTLDGTELEFREGQTVFAGPDGALLRLKREQDDKGPWTLLVNERKVEEAGKSGEGLRDLRSMTEGSYTIASGFSAKGVLLRRHLCRKFRFLVGGTPHQVLLGNKDRTWQVAFDDVMVDQEKYSILDSAVVVEFTIPATDGTMLPACLEITWSMISFAWQARLRIGDIDVPLSWSKMRGRVRKVVPPEVFSGASAGLMAPVFSDAQIDLASEEEEDDDTTGSDVMEEDEAENQRLSVVLESLPQGVSYDRESEAFQANIRDSKTGRFIFLGEFATPERAHQAYLEALPRYNPDKALVPAVH